MTDKEKARRNERYADYKLAYAAFMLCYPFGLEDLDGEEWRDIKGYEGHYQISNYGRVKSSYMGKVKIVKPDLSTVGYLGIGLYKKGTYRRAKIHRLVAEAFILNPENKKTVDHIFNNKFDNYFENLRWATQAENNQYAYDTGAKKTGEESYQAKLTNEQVRYCRAVYNPFDKNFNAKALAKLFGVKKSVIYNLANFKTYKNVN